jgi:CopG family transcriptional regulator / antitoxin EndoAI
MSENKKIVVSLPESLLEEFEEVLDCKSTKCRNQFIREAVVSYIKDRKRTKMGDLMKKGYLEMAEINSEIAECGISCDFTDLAKYEAVLAESDMVDGTVSKKRRYILC